MKNIKIIVTDQTGKEYINAPTDLDPAKPFQILRWVDDELATKAEELFGGKIYDLGISEFVVSGMECSSENDIEGATSVATSANSAIFGADNETHNRSVKIIDKDGEIVDTGVKLKIHAYTSGLVVSLGRTGTNFFGTTFDLYFNKMTSRNMKSGSIGYAKVFGSWKEVKKFIEKYTSQLLYIAGNTTTVFGVKVIGDGVKTDAKTKDEVAEMLNVINGYPKDLEDHTDIPENISTPEMMAEALHRMVELNLYDQIISEFRKTGRIYMSENYGTLYDLDDEAKKAIDKIREYGLMPYHVIKTNLLGRPVYDVLYVSNSGEDWEYERPVKDGWVGTWCWMTDYQDSEMGSIKVEQIAGGLRRVA